MLFGDDVEPVDSAGEAHVENPSLFIQSPPEAIGL